MSPWKLKALALTVCLGAPLHVGLFFKIFESVRKHPTMNAHAGNLLDDIFLIGLALGLGGLSLWNLFGVALLLAKSRFARMVLVPHLVIVFLLYGWPLLDHYNPLSIVHVLWSAPLLTYFVFSEELTKALSGKLGEASPDRGA